MMNFEVILQKLRSGGFRLTSARKSIIRIFLDSGAPLTAVEVMALLQRIKVNVNKTTVYREINFLISQDMLRELHLGDGRKRYEVMKDDHHHHLFCVSCSGVECVELERCLEAEEKRISEEKTYKIGEITKIYLGNPYFNINNKKNVEDNSHTLRKYNFLKNELRLLCKNKNILVDDYNLQQKEE